MANKMWQITRSKYVQIAKNLLKKAHVNYYHGYFLKSDLSSVNMIDTRGLTVKVIQNASDIGNLSQKERDHYAHFFTKGDVVVGAFRGNDFLGFLCVSLYKAFLPEIKQQLEFDGAYFWSGHILPQYRNQGLGRILVNQSIEILRNDFAITNGYMMIETDNIPSQKMVAHNGFHPYKSVRFIEIGRRTHYNETPVAPSKSP
jgi:ribosomal protein S18 acetylase RimI-like enzyme